MEIYYNAKVNGIAYYYDSISGKTVMHSEKQIFSKFGESISIDGNFIIVGNSQKQVLLN